MRWLGWLDKLQILWRGKAHRYLPNSIGSTPRWPPQWGYIYTHVCVVFIYLFIFKKVYPCVLVCEHFAKCRPHLKFTKSSSLVHRCLVSIEQKYPIKMTTLALSSFHFHSYYRQIYGFSLIAISWRALPCVSQTTVIGSLSDVNLWRTPSITLETIVNMHPKSLVPKS